MPADSLIDGVLILSGGILLLVPGIITDLIGLTLLIPFTRLLYRKWLKKKFEKNIRNVGQSYYQNQRKKAEVRVIEEGIREKDFRELTTDDADSHGHTLTN